MQGQRGAFGSRARRVNKTEDSWFRDGYLISMKPYPKELLEWLWGYVLPLHKVTQVIIDKTQRSWYAAQSSWQEWVSVIECISIEGTGMFPFIISKGKTLSRKWILENTPTDLMFSCNTISAMWNRSNSILQLEVQFCRHKISISRSTRG